MRIIVTPVHLVDVFRIVWIDVVLLKTIFKRRHIAPTQFITVGSDQHTTNNISVSLANFWKVDNSLMLEAESVRQSIDLSLDITFIIYSFEEALEDGSPVFHNAEPLEELQLRFLLNQTNDRGTKFPIVPHELRDFPDLTCFFVPFVVKCLRHPA